MFKIVFDIDNAAFQEGYGREETARILEKITQEVLDGRNSGTIMDVNGNKVGYWQVN